MTHKRLTLSDRIAIESGIANGLSFRKIAISLDKSHSTISKEVLNNRTHIEAMHTYSNDCIYAADCSFTHLCGDQDCPYPCKWCRKEKAIGNCHTKCLKYRSSKCPMLLYSPYVCNNCQFKNSCTKDRYVYSAKEADSYSTIKRSSSRSGSKFSDEKLDKIDKILFNGIVKNGQSVAHIIAIHGKELGICERTAYNLIDKGILRVRNIDLVRKTRYAPRKKTEDPSRKDRNYKIGRSYSDFKDYVTSHTDELVCEMDTVIGLQHDRKRLLTLFFRKNHIILIFLLPDGKASSVARIFNWLESKLGLDVFRRLFYAILTDNGSEFQRVEELEVSPENKYRTNIYFCEPMNPSQKGAIEKAHVEIRKILPKKTSFQNLEQKDLILIMNHVNSYLRKDLGFKCPYDLVREDDHDMLKLMKVMHLEKIHPDQVKLLPSLLNK